jgi:hypothetical protein
VLLCARGSITILPCVKIDVLGRIHAHDPNISLCYKHIYLKKPDMWLRQ